MTTKTAKNPSISLPSDLSYLPMAYTFVRDIAGGTGFEEDAIKKLELAVEEAVSNVITHAFGPEENAEFQIICQKTPLGLKTVIKDQGMPFDPERITDYKPEKLQEDSSTAGLGLFLMNQCVDEVIFLNLGREGKEVHLIKYLDASSLPDTQQAVAESQPSPGYPPKSIPFKVRKAKPIEAVEIAKCAYDAYGYSYIHEHVYFPERIKKMIEDGTLISLIAVTKDDSQSIMAHNAFILEDIDERVAEMGMAFTKSEYQNQGCARRLSLHFIPEAIKKRLLGVWSTAVTSHIYSQKALLRGGFLACAIFMAYRNDKWDNKNFTTQAHRPCSILTWFTMPVIPRFSPKMYRGPVFFPQHHHEILSKIYSNLKKRPKVLSLENKSVASSNDLPLIEVRSKAHDQHAWIELKAHGADSVGHIATTVKSLCQDNIKSIYLCLNLTDPHTALLTEEFEALGFFFCGIRPRPISGDQLILQFLNETTVDYDDIQVYSDFAKELLKYIKEHDPHFSKENG